MPCFFMILLASLRTSPSKPGRIWSRNSTQVTLAPSRRQTCQARPITGADDDHVLGHLGQLQRAGAVDDHLLVDLDPGSG